MTPPADHYLPIQKLEKICPNRSSLVICSGNFTQILLRQTQLFSHDLAGFEFKQRFFANHKMRKSTLNGLEVTTPRDQLAAVYG